MTRSAPRAAESWSEATAGAPPDRDGSLVARTVRRSTSAAALLDLLPADATPSTWLRRGEGMVGWGVAAEIRDPGPTRFADADKWWTETTGRAIVRDEVGEPGTGLVCFGTLRASPTSPATRVLVVPEWSSAAAAAAPG